MKFKNLPKSGNTLRKIVLEFSKNFRISIIIELSKKKSGEVVGKRFSLFFDEWTSQRNRRYLNIIVHEQKYKLNLHTDIVAIITDGASVMKKVGRIINIVMFCTLCAAGDH